MTKESHAYSELHGTNWGNSKKMLQSKDFSTWENHLIELFKEDVRKKLQSNTREHHVFTTAEKQTLVQRFFDTTLKNNWKHFIYKVEDRWYIRTDNESELIHIYKNHLRTKLMRLITQVQIETHAHIFEEKVENILTTHEHGEI